MEEIKDNVQEIETVSEADLDEISGGAGAAKRHVKIVNCRTSVNVRSTPNSESDSNKIGQAFLGDRYVFYGWKGNWAQVQYGARKAYIFKDYVQIV